MPDNIRVTYETDPLDLPAREAMPLTMIMAEFVSNSLKHGFPDGRAGRISITGRARDDGYLLSLSDDGDGQAAKPRTAAGSA